MTDPNSMYLNLQLSFPAVSQHYIIFVLFYRKPVLWIHQDVGPIWIYCCGEMTVHCAVEFSLINFNATSVLVCW